METDAFTAFARIMLIFCRQCPTNNCTEKCVKPGFLVQCNVCSTTLYLNCSFDGKLADFFKPKTVIHSPFFKRNCTVSKQNMSESLNLE